MRGGSSIRARTVSPTESTQRHAAPRANYLHQKCMRLRVSGVLKYNTMADLSSWQPGAESVRVTRVQAYISVCVCV